MKRLLVILSVICLSLAGGCRGAVDTQAQRDADDAAGGDSAKDTTLAEPENTPAKLTHILGMWETTCHRLNDKSSERTILTVEEASLVINHELFDDAFCLGARVSDTEADYTMSDGGILNGQLNLKLTNNKFLHTVFENLDEVNAAKLCGFSDWEEGESKALPSTAIEGCPNTGIDLFLAAIDPNDDLQVTTTQKIAGKSVKTVQVFREQGSGR